MIITSANYHIGSSSHRLIIAKTMIMDCRVTLNAGETFLELLTTSYKSGQKVSLLIDDGGMTRMEGVIKTIDTTASSPIIELASGGVITLDKIVAVNGVFRPEYGEC
jgi:hypothetical protein